MYVDEVLNNIFLQGTDKPLKKLAKFKNNREFINVFSRLVNDALNRYSFEGLPETVSERVLQQALLYYGNVVFFEKAGNLLALPGGASTDFNIYGDPKNAFVWGKNGYTQEISLYIPGGENGAFIREGVSGRTMPEEFTGVYVRENRLNFPCIEYCIEYADAIADTMRTLDVVRANIKQPYIITAEESVIPSVKAFFRNRDNNENYIISSGIFPADKINLLPFDVNDQNLKNATELVEWYLTQFYSIIGVQTRNNPDKKAQVSVEEIEGDTESTELQIDKVIDCLQMHLDIVNKCFSTNIRVKKNEMDSEKSGVLDGKQEGDEE